MSEIMKTDLAERIERLIAEARKRTVAAVNTAMVYTYYEIGRMIVEDEQQGEQRAEYGKAVIKELAEKLTKKFGKGFSAQNLANMRQFFLTYSVGQPIFQTLSRKSSLPLTKPQNTQILSDKSESENSAKVFRNSQIPQTPSDQLHFTLSWSHYLKLMRIESTCPKGNNQIFASKYQTYLPSKEDLQRLLEENIK
jgi:hypothetical protein